jgi:hypothetical protein
MGQEHGGKCGLFPKNTTLVHRFVNTLNRLTVILSSAFTKAHPSVQAGTPPPGYAYWVWNISDRISLLHGSILLSGIKSEELASFIKHSQWFGLNRAWMGEERGWAAIGFHKES